MTRRVLALLLTPLSVLLLAGCAGDTTTEVTAARLDEAGVEVGSSWILESARVDGRPLALLPDRPITFDRTEDGVEGQSSCNTYTEYTMDAEYTTEVDDAGDGDVVFPQLMNTEMGCPLPGQESLDNPIMDLEESYLDALRDTTEVEVDEDMLRLSGPDATLEFRRATGVGTRAVTSNPDPDASAAAPLATDELVGTRWELASVSRGEVESTAQGDGFVQLDPEGTMEAWTGCRALSGQWRVEGSNLRFPTLAAEGRCTPNRVEQDGIVVSVLEDAVPELEGDRLVLRSRHGEADAEFLTLRAAPLADRPAAADLVARRSGGIAGDDHVVAIVLPDGPVTVEPGGVAIDDDELGGVLEWLTAEVDEVDWDDLRTRAEAEPTGDDDHQWAITYGTEQVTIDDRQLPDPRPDLFLALDELLGSERTDPVAGDPSDGTSPLPERSTWVLRGGEVDGETLRLLDDRPIRFFHQDGEIGGQSTCNSYGGVLDPDPDAGGPVVVDVSATAAACTDDGGGADDSLDNPVMRLEVAYLGALGRATSLEVDGDELRLVGPSSSLVFERARPRGGGSEPDEVSPAPSTDGSWWLEDGHVDGRPIEVPNGVRVLLALQDAQVTGQVGCNGYAASPVLDGRAIDLGPLDTTGEICNEREADLQAMYLDALSRVDSISRDEGRLTLAGDGAKLTFTTREPLGFGPEG